MKVGDLVVIKGYCRESGRMAIVVEVPFWETKAIKIRYTDTNEISAALTTNLELVSEAKIN